MRAIDVKDVSICYKIGDLKQIGLKEFIIRKVKGIYSETSFWANKHVTFNLEQGEMLGIIGSNGAGKSTLLKAISGIMPPTEGSVHVRGRIAALLELSSGFDPELTVKENAYLRGALLGYTKKFMEERYDEIIKFAELEDFQEHKFRQLSSGMKSRLAFSVACLVDPDILILDEVLSVGDGAFRKKSSERIREILKRGVSGILVSHSVGQVREMCDKVLWLDKGVQIAFGPTKEICDAYEHFLASPKESRVLPKDYDQILKISEDYDLFRYMSMMEKKNSDNPELLNGEKPSACEQRWMKIIQAYSEEERNKHLDEMRTYNSKPAEDKK